MSFFKSTKKSPRRRIGVDLTRGTCDGCNRRGCPVADCKVNDSATADAGECLWNRCESLLSVTQGNGKLVRCAARSGMPETAGCMS